MYERMRRVSLQCLLFFLERLSLVVVVRRNLIGRYLAGLFSKCNSAIFIFSKRLSFPK